MKRSLKLGYAMYNHEWSVLEGMPDHSYIVTLSNIKSNELDLFQENRFIQISLVLRPSNISIKDTFIGKNMDCGVCVVGKSLMKISNNMSPNTEP